MSKELESGVESVDGEPEAVSGGDLGEKLSSAMEGVDVSLGDDGGGESSAAQSAAGQATLGQAAQGGQPVKPQAPALPQAVAFARHLGYELDAPDDATALRLLVQRAREAEQAQQIAAENERLRRYYEERLPYESEFQQFVQSKRPKAAEPEAPEFFWKKPEYDERWGQYRGVDPETGLPKWREDTPAGVREKFEAYHQSRSEFANKLIDKPQEVLEPFVNHLVQRGMEQALAKVQQSNSIQTLLSPQGPNAAYLYEFDERGNVRRDQFGNPVESESAREIARYATLAGEAGITDPQRAFGFAKAMHERDVYARMFAQSQRETQTRMSVPGQAAAPSPATIAGAVHAPSGKTTSQVLGRKPPGMSLVEAMRQNFAAAGIGDDLEM